MSKNFTRGVIRRGWKQGVCTINQLFHTPGVQFVYSRNDYWSDCEKPGQMWG
jgi:hypothetical protein